MPFAVLPRAIDFLGVGPAARDAVASFRLRRRPGSHLSYVVDGGVGHHERRVASSPGRLHS